MAIRAVLEHTHLVTANDMSALVWDADDALSLRRDARVIGTLVGPLRTDRPPRAAGSASKPHRKQPGALALPPGTLPNRGLPLRLDAVMVFCLVLQGELVVEPGTEHAHDTLTNANDLIAFMDAQKQKENERWLDDPFRARVATLLALRRHQDPSSGTGLYIAPAMQYGVDYALYRADPMITHSDAMVRVLHEDAQEGGIPVRDWMAASRVATNTQKALVYTRPKDDTSALDDSAWLKGIVSSQAAPAASMVQAWTVQWTGW
ncbi:hypothetical protein BC828DRAFT_377828 [Blastocladiella britannica]|nr:hypothetical protein BC828DRAFT_377828 [Blastocladiella britannica]